MTDLIELTIPLLRDHDHALCVSKTGSGDDACFLWKGRDVSAYEVVGLGQVVVLVARSIAQARGLCG